MVIDLACGAWFKSSLKMDPLTSQGEIARFEVSIVK